MTTDATMNTLTLSIPGAPEKGWMNGFSAIFAAFFTVGLILVVFSFGARPDTELFVWVFLFGFGTLLLMGRWRTDVYRDSGEIVKSWRLFGVPLWRREYRFFKYGHVVRRMPRDAEGGSKGYFQPQIFIMCIGGEVLLQWFFATPNSDHPFSKEWAERIGAATGLPVIDEILGEDAR